jgi:hypothetical protein
VYAAVTAEPVVPAAAGRAAEAPPNTPAPATSPPA